MDLSYTAADLAFRDKVRSFLAANLPADLQKKVRNHLRLTRRDYVRWHQIVARQGAQMLHLEGVIGQPPGFILCENLQPGRRGRKGIGLKHHVSHVGHQHMPQIRPRDDVALIGGETGHHRLRRPSVGRGHDHRLDIMGRQKGQQRGVVVHEQGDAAGIDRPQRAHEGLDMGDAIAGRIGQDDVPVARVGRTRCGGAQDGAEPVQIARAGDVRRSSSGPQSG